MIFQSEARACQLFPGHPPSGIPPTAAECCSSCPLHAINHLATGDPVDEKRWPEIQFPSQTGSLVPHPNTPTLHDGRSL